MATRTDFFRKMGIVKEYPDLDKYTVKAYEDLEEKIWRENLESSPHGRPWFTSFHASSFPDDEKPCERKLLYTMMDIPNEKPNSPFLRAVADIGQAVEYQIVYRWGVAGLTLDAPVPKWDGDKMEQAKFTDRATWLTGSMDAILDLRPEWDAVTPVDVKSKAHNVVEEMRAKRRSYDKKHYLQVQAYLYLCNIFHEERGWKKLGLEPARGGFIYYASRQDPRTTAEFWVPIDWDLINKGIEVLKSVKENFENEQLPERPKGWKWTEEPCKWCDFKKHACKPDYKNKVKSLKDSNAIQFAMALRGSYNFDEVKREVEKRWA
jgi:CRISPR/Cas system-associated exonuclease Cas4 (RecB family)